MFEVASAKEDEAAIVDETDDRVSAKAEVVGLFGAVEFGGDFVE